MEVTRGGGGVLVAGALALGVGTAAVKVAGDSKSFRNGDSWVSQGGTPHGTLRAQWLGFRNVAKWGVRELIKPSRTRWVLTTHKAETQARKWENELFHGGIKHYGKKIRIGYDNGPDAFRHTYASASIVYRLMRTRRASVDEAVTFLHGAGNAHERDSWLHTFSQAHGRYSSEMDVNNNLLGHKLGAMLATRHAAEGVDLLVGEEQLRRMVLDAIGDGVRLDDTKGLIVDKAGLARAAVMDRIDAAPRAATWSDIAKVAPNGRAPLRDVSGMPMLRLHVPDAPGFPTPVRDGKIDMSMPYARLGPQELRIQRDDIPQA